MKLKQSHPNQGPVAGSTHQVSRTRDGAGAATVVCGRTAYFSVAEVMWPSARAWGGTRIHSYNPFPIMVALPHLDPAGIPVLDAKFCNQYNSETSQKGASHASQDD